MRRVERVLIKSNTPRRVNCKKRGRFPGVSMRSRRLVRALDVGGALVTLHRRLLLGNKNVDVIAKRSALLCLGRRRRAASLLCPRVASAAADTGDKKRSEIVVLSLRLSIRCRVCRCHGSAGESS